MKIENVCMGCISLFTAIAKHTPRDEISMSTCPRDNQEGAICLPYIQAFDDLFHHHADANFGHRSVPSPAVGRSLQQCNMPLTETTSFSVLAQTVIFSLRFHFTNIIHFCYLQTIRQSVTQNEMQMESFKV